MRAIDMTHLSWNFHSTEESCQALLHPSHALSPPQYFLQSKQVVVLFPRLHLAKSSSWRVPFLAASSANCAAILA